MKPTRCHTLSWRPSSLARLAAVSAVVATVACGSSSTGPSNEPTGEFKGTLVGNVASGVLTLNFPASVSSRSQGSLVRVAEAATTIQVTGTLALTGGASIQLTGTYNPGTEPQLVLAGGGYGLTGDYSAASGVFAGTSTFPGGQTGLWTVSANGTAVKVFCGTYSSMAGHGNGTWNLVLDKNNNLTGVATGAGQLVGTLSGTSLLVNFTNGRATGTLDPTTGAGSGNYSSTGDDGTWTANTSGC